MRCGVRCGAVCGAVGGFVHHAVNQDRIDRVRGHVCQHVLLEFLTVTLRLGTIAEVQGKWSDLVRMRVRRDLKLRISEEL